MEQWKEIEELPSYMISSTGRVRNSKGRILKSYIINSGYECITISCKGERFRDLVHRLVAKAFCEGYAEGLVVNHKDGNRLNNTQENLEWVTVKENIHDMQKRGTMNTHSARAANLKNQLKKVDMYSPDGDTYIRTFDSVKEATAFVGITSGKITEVVKGRRFRAGGYHWKYHDPKDNYSYYKKGMR